MQEVKGIKQFRSAVSQIKCVVFLVNKYITIKNKKLGYQFTLSVMFGFRLVHAIVCPKENRSVKTHFGNIDALFCFEMGRCFLWASMRLYGMPGTATAQFIL